MRSYVERPKAEMSPGPFNFSPPTNKPFQGRGPRHYSFTVGVCTRYVMSFRIFSDHAIGGESWCEAGHACADLFDPGGRNPVHIALIEHGYNLVFEQRINLFSFPAVPFRVGIVLLPVSYCPPHFRRVCLGPPTVKL